MGQDTSNYRDTWPWLGHCWWRVQRLGLYLGLVPGCALWVSDALWFYSALSLMRCGVGGGKRMSWGHATHVIGVELGLIFLNASKAFILSFGVGLDIENAARIAPPHGTLCHRDIWLWSWLTVWHCPAFGTFSISLTQFFIQNVSILLLEFPCGPKVLWKN